MAAPPPEAIPARAWASLGVASATIVLILLDAGFVSLAFPEIEEEFSDTSRSTLSWVSSGYFIALASLMLIAGRLAERWGRRRVFLGGLAVYAVGAFAMGLAPGPAALIAARGVQGAGAAALTPVSLAIALREFPVSRRSTAIAGWAVIGGSTGVLAPTVGAVVVDLAGWRAPFLLVVVLLAATAVAAMRVLRPDDAPPGPTPIDPPSVVLSLLAVGSLSLAVSKARSWGPANPLLVAAVIVGLVATPLLIRRSRTAPGSLLDLSLFSIRSYAVGSV